MWNAPNSEYVDHPRLAGKSRWRLDEETLCMADAVARDLQIPVSRRRPRGRVLVQRKSLVAFLFALPLIMIVACLVIYPAFYSMHLATLNKSMTKFVGFGNFEFLFRRNTFWMVVEQSVLFAVTAVIFKALIGFIVAHFVHNIPMKGQRKWRGMLLIPWVIPPAMSTLAWLWLFDPSYSAFNWILTHLGLSGIPWLGNPYWARFGVILVNVWVGSPFFMIMYLAALKSVPEQLHEAAAIDGANWLQKIWYVNLPMMRNIIQITALFSLIVTFANFDIVKILTNGGPVDHPTLENYVNLLTQKTFLTFFRNSAIVSVLVVSLTMVISVLAAFSLARMKFWGSATLATGVFLTYLIPDTLLFIPLFKIFAWIHDVTGIELINHWWVLIFLYPTLTVPFCTWIMIGYFSSIPKELDEAALIDGASYMQILTRVFIPVALPGIIAATIFAFTVSWANFLYPLAFTTSEDQLVLPVGIVTTLIKGDVYNWGQIMTGALLGAAPPLVIYAFLMDYYIAGLTAGATKG